MRLKPMIAAACLAAAGLSAAADSEAAVRKQTNIPAQGLGPALNTLAKERDFQVVYVSEEVAQLRTGGASGELTPDEALTQLLSGTGLTYRYLDDKTVTILSLASLSQSPAAMAPESVVRIDLAQLDASPSQGEEQGEDLTKKLESEEDDRPVRGIPEILVRGKKGQRTLNADIERTRDDVRPYVILDRATIEKSGARDIDELLRKNLPMNYVQSSSSQRSGNGSLAGNSSQVALRGLSGGETLILVDGRKVTKSVLNVQVEEAQANINGIPLAAIERIEVLPASASGIYGGAATGGVVNVILRRDYSGLETALSYEDSFEGGGGGKRIDIFAGTSSLDKRLSLQVSASFADTKALQRGDRSYISAYRTSFQEDQLRRVPSTYYNAFNPPVGTTTNVSSAAFQFDPTTGEISGVAPLTLKSGRSLGAPITFLPIGYRRDGTGDEELLIQNAGRYNVGLVDSAQLGGGALSDLIGATRTSSLDVTIRRNITEGSNAFFEIAGTREDYTFAEDQLSGTFFIPASVPTNPFEQDIFVNAPLGGGLAGDQASRSRSDNRRALAGVNIQLPNSWSSSVEYSYSQSRARQLTAPTGLFLDSASTAVSAGVVDVLQDRAGYIAELAELRAPESIIEPTTSRLRDISLRLAGPLFNTGVGPVRASLLGEDVRQAYGAVKRVTFQSDGSEVDQQSTGGDSRVRSMYVEVTTPLASAAKPLLGLRLAELQLAARRDSYRQTAAFLQNAGTEGPPAKGTFSSTVPTYGLRVQPISDLTLRASYGRGFLPPYLNQLQEATPIEADLSFLTDPARGGQPLGVVRIRSGGNADLKPESSESTSAGVIVEPRAIPALRVSFDWTKISKRDNILGLSFTQRTLDNANLYPGFVTRASSNGADPGQITELNFALRNVFRSESESYDLAADYEIYTGDLRWKLAASATRLIHNIQQQSLDAPSLEFSGTAAFPSWAGGAGLSVGWRALSVNFTGRYLDSHWIRDDRGFDVAQNQSLVPSQRYLDVSAEYRFSGQAGALDSVLAGSKIRMGIKNVFNTRPRYLASDSVTHSDLWDDPMRISYFVTFSMSFGNQ